MSGHETNQPLTELCERSWKLLYRHGAERVDHEHNHLMKFRLGDYVLRSRNRFLYIERTVVETGGRHRTESVFSVDEDGAVGACDRLHCALALEAFRQYSILDDLAECGDG